MAAALPSQTIFRRYDIRGIVGSTLTKDLVYRIGKAYAALLKNRGHQTAIVARDVRPSSPDFSLAFSEALLDSGIHVIDIGAVPTPVAYFACHHLDVPNTAIITGSHNPSAYNGIKLVLNGLPVHGKALQSLYKAILQPNYYYGAGSISYADVIGAYIDRICGDITLDRPLKIAIDCGNGIAGVVAPKLFRQLGCQVTELYCQPDGEFPNHHPNPSEPKNLLDLRMLLMSEPHDIGLAFDGDGDRLGVLDNEGNIIWPDRVLMLLSKEILKRKPGGRILYDVKSTQLLKPFIETNGGIPELCISGHSILRQKMRDSKALLGGELSGHIFFNDRWYGFDDGTYSAARVLEIISREKLSSHKQFQHLPSNITTPELNIPFQSEHQLDHFMKRFIQRHSEFKNAQVTLIDGVRAEYIDGWGLVRASNTSPCLTIRFEGKTQSVMERIQATFRKQLLAIQPDLKLPF